VNSSFVYGAKEDGVPYPLIAEQWTSISSMVMLRDAVNASRMGDKEKLHSIQALKRFVPETQKS
jgi:hypothetical protein